MSIDDWMKYVELEEFSLLSFSVPNDNPLQCVLCVCELLNFQICEQQPGYHSIIL